METDILKNIIQPVDLQNKIIPLQDKLPAILDDFKKYYVFFNKNPTYSEYQTIYENIQNNLNSINTELVTISNKTNENSRNISDYLLKLNKSIEEEKTKNANFIKIQNTIYNNYDNSKIMIDEYKEIYNNAYMKNVLLIFGIILSSVTLIKVFTNNVKT